MSDKDKRLLGKYLVLAGMIIGALVVMIVAGEVTWTIFSDPEAVNSPGTNDANAGAGLLVTLVTLVFAAAQAVVIAGFYSRSEYFKEMNEHSEY